MKLTIMGVSSSLSLIAVALRPLRSSTGRKRNWKAGLDRI